MVPVALRVPFAVDFLLMFQRHFLLRLCKVGADAFGSCIFAKFYKILEMFAKILDVGLLCTAHAKVEYIGP